MSEHGAHISLGAGWVCKACQSERLYCLGCSEDGCGGMCCACTVGHCNCCEADLGAIWQANGSPEEWDERPHFKALRKGRVLS